MNAYNRDDRDGVQMDKSSRVDRRARQETAHDLTEAVARITTANLHPEVDTGSARGNERW